MTHTAFYGADLAFALRAAEALDAITLPAYGTDLTVESKADLSPVTEIDRAAERALRDLVEAEYPGDAVVGEEYGATGNGPRQWVVDPIDGTKNFIRGVPAWASLIALLVDGVPVVGVVSAPALGRRWYAAKGQGAWLVSRVPGTPFEPRELSVSSRATLGEASLSYASLDGWAERGNLDAFVDLCRGVARSRAFGDFWSYMLVAEGAVDIACEPELELYDMAALVPIVQEAGGRFTSLAGVDGPHGGDAVATNGVLHDAVLNALTRT